MKRLLALVVVMLACLPLTASAGHGNILTAGKDGPALSARLHKLVPSAFLHIYVSVSVATMTPADMQEMFGTPNVLGFYTGGPKPTIFIRSDLTGYNRDVVLVHEFGHYIYFHELGFRERQAYDRLWRSEKFADDEYRGVNPAEGFAEAFAFYVLSEYNEAKEDENTLIWNVQRRLEKWTKTVQDSNFRSIAAIRELSFR